jgi:two-component system, cell cycle sensor histidine kinase and response regulator CckA
MVSSRIRSRWTGAIFLLQLGAAVAHGQSPVRVSLGTSAPLEYRDAKGNPQGFAVDVIREAARREGVKVVWEQGHAAAVNNNALREGSLDLIVAGTATQERVRSFYVSDSWWWTEMIALAPATSDIRQESQLDGKHLSTPASASLTVGERYKSSLVTAGPNTVWAAEQACMGQSDAAVIENMYVRELLMNVSSVCRSIRLRTFDVSVRREYHLIARPEIAGTARALRQRIDEMTLDGTLATLAAKHLPVSTPEATRMAELLRGKQTRQIRNIGIEGGSLAALAGFAFLFWQQLSRKTLVRLNERLQAAQTESAAYLEQLQTRLTERAQAEDALRISEQRLRQITETIPVGIVVFNMSGHITFSNSGATSLLGGNRAAVLGEHHTSSAWTITDYEGRPILPDQRPFRQVLATGQPMTGAKFALAAPGGNRRCLSVNAAPLFGKNGEMEGVVESMEDVTSRYELESHYRQAQKMESLGQMAGGVAHDFNNLLTVITGFSQLLLSQPEILEQQRAGLRQIASAGQRASDLTRQLLAFSRKQQASPRALQLNEIIRNDETMLRHLVGEQVMLDMRLEPSLGIIFADASQIQQIVLNLAINARDAMPRGGRILIETANKEMATTGGYCHDADEPCVELRVEDDGCGMDGDTQKHIFEPFFTTKDSGKGTGLGLSTVYGIVQQNGGTIEVESAPDRGARFIIRFPRIQKDASKAPREEIQASVPEARADAGDRNTVLLVEDQGDVRRYLAECLTLGGYRVIQATNGAEGIKLARQNQIDLLVSDMVMPGMSGKELAETLDAEFPGLRVLLISGYSTENMEAVRLPRNRFDFLQKPIPPGTLLKAVAGILSRTAASSAR